MKLVEILALELKKWPDCDAVTQDNDGEINYFGSSPRFCGDIKQWLAGSGCACDGTFYDTAEDYSTAIVTRDQWQTERDRISGVTVSAELQSTDGPLDWRDRIREIDAKQIALTNERAELVAKLATEGLALCDAPKQVAASNDMNDWRNWKYGDLVRVTRCNDVDIEVGEIVTVVKVEKPEYKGLLPVLIRTDDGCEVWPEDRAEEVQCVLEFVGRP